MAYSLQNTIRWGVVLFVGCLLLLWNTRHEIGLTWDEPAYMRAASEYTEWQSRFIGEGGLLLEPAIMRAYWEYNHEHPPMVKVWLGWVEAALPESINDIDRFRFGAMLLAAALVSLVSVVVAQHTAPWVAPITAFVLLAMPRFFFHAHLAALDVPGALAYTIVLLGFWALRNSPRWWASTLLLGVVFGLALATKINAAFVLPVLFAWWVMQSREWHLLARIIIMALLGSLIFVAVWPWLWVNPVEHLVGYLLWVTVSHWQIPQWWLGQSLLPPPWYFAPLMAVMVTPVAMLIGAIAGAVAGLRAPTQRSFTVLLIVATLMPLMALMASSTVYDNDRLFMPFFPFIAMLVGMAIWHWYTWLGSHKVTGQRWLTVLAVLAILASPVSTSLRLWPHLLSYYSESVGGLPGAQRLRMDHTYWNETYRAGMRFIDDQAEPGATVWIESWSQDVPHTYQRAGMARTDITYVSGDGSSIWGTPLPRIPLVDADYVMITFRFAGWTPPVWALMSGNNQPIYTVERDGVTLLAIYRMP